MQTLSRDYFSYLLRIWKSEESGQPVWRISIEDTLHGEPVYFTSLDALNEYLQSQVGSETPLIRSEQQE
jgi:hypothetical protein